MFYIFCSFFTFSTFKSLSLVKIETLFFRFDLFRKQQSNDAKVALVIATIDQFWFSLGSKYIFQPGPEGHLPYWDTLIVPSIAQVHQQVSILQTGPAYSAGNIWGTQAPVLPSRSFSLFELLKTAGWSKNGKDKWIVLDLSPRGFWGAFVPTKFRYRSRNTDEAPALGAEPLEQNLLYVNGGMMLDPLKERSNIPFFKISTPRAKAPLGALVDRNPTTEGEALVCYRGATSNILVLRGGRDKPDEDLLLALKMLRESMAKEYKIVFYESAPHVNEGDFLLHEFKIDPEPESPVELEKSPKSGILSRLPPMIKGKKKPDLPKQQSLQEQTGRARAGLPVTLNPDQPSSLHSSPQIRPNSPDLQSEPDDLISRSPPDPVYEPPPRAPSPDRDTAALEQVYRESSAPASDKIKAEARMKFAIVKMKLQRKELPTREEREGLLDAFRAMEDLDDIDIHIVEGARCHVHFLRSFKRERD